MKAFTKNFTILFSLIGLLMFTSCKKDGLLSTSSPGKPATTPPPATTTPVVPATGTTVPADATIYDLGTGSGDLTIDGATLNIKSNSFIRIKGGSYTTITIKNILATTDKPVFIKNTGTVIISGSMETNNISNVVISGDNVSGVTYGFQFNNISYRAISMNGKMSGVMLKSMSFKNVSDYVIAGTNTNGNGLNYDGTANTRTDGFKILNCLFDNAGPISFGGNLDKDTGEDNGFFKDLEVAYNIFQNTDVGTVCSFTNVQDYNIHNNVVNNINQTSTTHNGVFFMQGNGIFHDNKLTNYQGNSIRMWLYSRGSTPATNLIYNNICYNTRKYSGFELQGFDRYIYAGKTTFANAKVYNNTVGHMNTTKDWEGQILDLYNISGGSLQYYNNLGYDLFSSTKTITDMINNMSDTKITLESNNKYFPLQKDAVANTTNFTSLFTGIGAPGI